MQIKLTHLEHYYSSPGGDKRQVLAIPDWNVTTGSQILLRGVSGSGKTTLFNILAGLMQPTTGIVQYDDIALYALTETNRDRFRARYIGYIFQNHYLLNTLTALENVIMPLVFAGARKATERKSRALDLLAAVGLQDYSGYRPVQLSTGQRMRVGIARALANHPPILLADEPTASLDRASGDQVMDFIQTFCETHQSTLIVASHDPALQSRFQTIVDLNAGQLHIQEGALS